MTVVDDPSMEDRLEELRVIAWGVKKSKGTGFKEIEGLNKNTSVDVFVFVTSVSKVMTGEYGDYR